jgi:hypothetical protein
MPALETIAGSATAPDTTITDLSAASGNSFTVRAFSGGAKAYLAQAWAGVQSDGIFRILSPRLHDNVNGIYLETDADNPRPLFRPGRMCSLESQDTLVPALSGSGTSGDVEVGCYTVYYDDISGADARLIDQDELERRAITAFAMQVTLSATSSGGWSGSQVLTADQDQLKANTDYALIGYSCDEEIAAWRIYGQDTGNLGIGAPGIVVDKQYSGRYFINLSKELGKPAIPVINSANKDNTSVDFVDSEDAATPNISLILVQLAEG